MQRTSKSPQNSPVAFPPIHCKNIPESSLFFLMVRFLTLNTKWCWSIVDFLIHTPNIFISSLALLQFPFWSNITFQKCVLPMLLYSTLFFWLKILLLNNPIWFHMYNYVLYADNALLSFSPNLSPEVLTYIQLPLHICFWLLPG